MMQIALLCNGGSYRYCPDVDELKVRYSAFELMTHIPTLRQVGSLISFPTEGRRYW